MTSSLTYYSGLHDLQQMRGDNTTLQDLQACTHSRRLVACQTKDWKFMPRTGNPLCVVLPMLTCGMYGTAIPAGGLQDSARQPILHLLHLCSHILDWVSWL